MDERLLEERMLAAYREIAPEAGRAGDYLIRRLAKAMFDSGARVEIGNDTPLEKRTIHHSFDPDQRIVWVCKLWNQTMGYRSRAAIGRHVSDILAPHSYAQFLQEGWWDRLLCSGCYGPVDVTLKTADGRELQAKGKSDRLLDTDGTFLRTFAKLTVFLPRLATAACTSYALERALQFL